MSKRQRVEWPAMSKPQARRMADMAGGGSRLGGYVTVISFHGADFARS